MLGLGLRPPLILTVLGIFFIQLFPNMTACSPITYTNECRGLALSLGVCVSAFAFSQRLFLK